jgi:hypothetical protein
MRRVSLIRCLPQLKGCRRNLCGGRACHHDYIRHGTTTLFAALNVLDGSVIGRCMARHRHQEFIRFLNAVERAVPAGKLIHAILDNYAAHQASQGPRLAQPASALDLSLHADLVLLSRTHPAEAAGWRRR